jgi:hypothetical protein
MTRTGKGRTAVSAVMICGVASVLSSTNSDLERVAGQRLAQPVEQRADVAGLVARGHDDGQFDRG